MPTPTTFSITNLYKKILNDEGKEIERRPMLLRSLSSLIYRNDGTTVEDAIHSLETGKADLSGLSTLAVTGDWDDIQNKPAHFNTWRNIKVNGAEQINETIVSGPLDFVDGLNTNVDFLSDGNKLSINVKQVSPTSAGVAPQGTAVGAQTQGTKFLREDGVWAVPSYTVQPVNADWAASTGLAEIKNKPIMGTSVGRDVGVPGGIAELDSTGRVPASQLPSFVDDVIEAYYNVANQKFYKEPTFITEIPGESGKIYVNLINNRTYRWSGSTFVTISDTLALGTTSTSACRGDWGKAAYDFISAPYIPVNPATTPTADGAIWFETT